jgi:putative ABC transport system permease protein
MTGLILAGVDPLIAIRYQIVVMYMLLAATAFAALATARSRTRPVRPCAPPRPLLETPRG